MPHAELTPASWRAGGRPWPPPPDVHFSEQPMSAKGKAFADAVVAYCSKEAGSAPIAVLSCTHRRGLELAQRLGGGRVRPSLNPQDRGICDGLCAAEIREKAP